MSLAALGSSRGIWCSGQSLEGQRRGLPKSDGEDWIGFCDQSFESGEITEF